jgi:spore coat protein SA
MKILFIHDYPFSEGGGIETQTYLDSVYLSKNGHDVTIATTRDHSETYPTNNKQLHHTIRYIIIRSKKQLEKLIKENEIVSVQATFSLRKGMMDALEILNKIKKKHIISLRTTVRHIPFSRIANLKERAILLKEFSNYLKSDFCFIQTVSHCFDDTLDFLDVKKDYTVIHNGKDWKSFCMAKNTSIHSTDITYIGEISWMKGIHLLLTIIPYFLKRDPDITFRIIGSGQNKTEFMYILHSIIPEKDLQRIICIDYIENGKVYDYLIKTKIVFIPSLTESWCNVAMESIGSGAYVITSNIEGLKEVARESKNISLFELGDSSHAIRLITKVLKLTPPRPNITVQEKFSIQKKVVKLEEFYINM